jgi:hypothetical protein
MQFAVARIKSSQVAASPPVSSASVLTLTNFLLFWQPSQDSTELWIQLNSQLSQTTTTPTPTPKEDSLNSF